MMIKRKIKCDHEDCCRTYCSYFNLKRHIESSHMGVRKFQCEVCQKFLSSKQNYVDHQNIHTGVKPYVCEELGCDQKFRQLSQFYLHKQLHKETASRLPPGQPTRKDFLAMLTAKIGEDKPNFYNIPLFTYPSVELQLPLILKSQEFQLPPCPL